MQSFIVLGIIPGTQVQLNFTFWISVSIGFFTFLLLSSLWSKRQAFRIRLISHQIARAIDNFELIAV